MSFDKFYYKFGIRRLNDFLVPKILRIDDVVLPYWTTLHFFNFENEEFYPGESFPLTKFVKKNILHVPLKYPNPIRPFRREKVINETKTIREIYKQHRDIDVLLPKYYDRILSKKYRGLKYNVLSHVYDHIHDRYDYLETPMASYDKYQNGVYSLFMIIKDVINKAKLNKHVEPLDNIILYKVPTTLFKYNFIHTEINKKINTDYLRTFTTHKTLFYMDLYKVIDAMNLNNTFWRILLKDPDIDKILDKTTLGLIVNDKIVFLNLKYLLSLVKEHPNITNKYATGKIPGDKVTKLFYVLIKNLVLLPGFTTKEIESNKHADVIMEKTGIDLNKIVKDVKNPLDNILKNKPKDKDTSNIEIKNNDLEKENKVENKIDKLIEDVDDKILDKQINLIEDEEDFVISDSEPTKTIYDDLELEDLLKPQNDLTIAPKKWLDKLRENKKIDSSKYKKLTQLLEKTLEQKNPWNPKEKLKDSINITEKDIELKEEETKLPDLKVVKDKKVLHDPNDALNKKYFKNVWHKDMVRTILGLQRNGLIVKNIRIKENKDILGEYEDIEIDVTDLGKASYTIKTKIPKIREDGTFKISSNTYVLRKQKADVPIKKIDYNKVSLNTAYGKMFIVKAPQVKYDRGYSIYKQLDKLSDQGIIRNLIKGKLNLYEVKLPQLYAELIRYVKAFKFKNYNFSFNYIKRDEILPNPKDIDKIEQNGKYVVCGITSNDEPIVMDKNNDIYIYKKGKYEKIGDLLDLLNINKSKLKVEYSFAEINSKLIPIAHLLAFYLGLTNLLKKLKVKYEIHEGRKLSKDINDIVVRFKFHTLIIHPDNDLQRMILAGLTNYSKIIKNYDISNFDNREETIVFFNDIGLNLATVTKIEVMETLFVDPVSADILKHMGEPTNLIGLLIRASELLLDDYYLHPNDHRGYLLKGYYRIPQFIYKTIIDAVTKKKSEEFFGRSRLTVDPYQVWRIINEDSGTILEDDLNPLMNIKQKEDTTYLGFGGRSKDSMRTKSVRAIHETDLGVMSESSKDSGDVGMTGYMSANPVLKNVRGMKDFSKKIKDMNWSNLLSTSAMLAPFSIKDDPKRVLYTNIMNSHIIPIKDRKVFPVRTGYESVIPYKVGKKFVGIAEEEGVVETVNNDRIVVKYKTLGKKTYDIKDWTSKEEANTTYLHKLVTNVVKGQKVRKGDALYYDSGFFEPDIFDKTKVLYRPGTICRLATEEITETHEDASLISKELSDKLGTNLVKVRDLILDKDDKIARPLKIGEEVNFNNPLFTIVSDLVGEDKLDEKTMEILQTFVKAAPKAKYKGKVIKLEVYYNCDYKDLSSSLKRLVDMSKEYMIDLNTGEKYNGKVNSSYSVRGKPLDEGKVHIKYYILVDEGMGTGDKAIVGNQLKTTITTVLDETVLTEDSREVDILFSRKGIMARIVNSFDLMSTTATVLDLITDKAVEMYGLTPKKR